MIVNQTDTGEYEVVAQDGTNRRLAGPFPTHAAAWRWVDRQSGELISKAEERAEWFFDQMAVTGSHRTGGSAA